MCRNCGTCRIFVYTKHRQIFSRACRRTCNFNFNRYDNLAHITKIHTNPILVGGIKFTSKKILQWAVIILGFSLNLNTIAVVGAKSLPVIICTVSASLIVAFIMMKILKVNSKTACLIGVGSSICGGSAIAATAPVIEAEDSDVARSVSVIFFFNILAALIFPVFGYSIGLGTEGFAVFAGTAVNDTSSVTAAASTAESIYNTSGILSAAVTVKLTRTLAIIPITLCLAFYRTRKAKKSNTDNGQFSFKKIFPWFILYFIGVPDDSRGQAIKAIIKTVDGCEADKNLVNEIKGFSNKRLASYKWIQYIEFTDEMPKTASGKIKRVALKARA